MMQIPFVDLAREYSEIQEELCDALRKVCSSGAFILGTSLKSLEENLATFLGVRHVVGVGNGSDATVLTLKALGVGLGDEVITVANSFVATVWSIRATGATPVLIDVCDDMNMDLSKVHRVVSERTKAIVPVHLTGNPINLKEVTSFCQDNGIHIVEDAAQAIGASIDDEKVGGMGIAGCFSLHPLKNLSVLGDGGFISTNDDSLARKLRLLRNHGLEDRDNCVLWGYNSRLDELQACFAQIKLKYFEQRTMRRIRLAERYKENLEGLLGCPQVPRGVRHVFHNFIVQSKSRDELADYLRHEGVETKIHYPIPFHHQKIESKDYRVPFRLSNTERLTSEILSLPIFPELTDEESEYIIEAVRRFYGS